MGLAGVSLGRELRALALSHKQPHRFGAAWHRLRTRSQTRVQTAPSDSKSNDLQMIGGTKVISPCVKSASPKLFLDLHTVLAPSGEQRRTGASAQVERATCSRPESRMLSLVSLSLSRSLSLSFLVLLLGWHPTVSTR